MTDAPAAGSSSTDMRCVVARAGARVLALPVDRVEETFRPLPVEPIPGAPACVTGAAIVRGRVTPVVDAARLIGASLLAPGRFVTLRVGAGRWVALAVRDVLGVRDLPREMLTDVPALLRDAQAETIEAIGSLDGALLVVLRESRLVPDQLWDAIACAGEA